jgi:Bacteriophage probable baseplate hub protein
MAEDARSGFYASRPILRVGGEDRPELGESQLLSLLVEETTLGLFRCEARLVNWGPHDDGVGFLYFGGDIFDFGKDLEVTLGAPGESRRVFAGRITGLEAQYPPERVPELTVLAEDRFQDLRMERRTRTFADVTDADVVRRIAGAHGLTADVDVDGPSHRVLAQLNQSDLAFLRERAAAVDAELWIEGRTLHAQARARRAPGAVSLTYGKNLLEFSVLADLAHQRSAVQVTGWDVGGKRAIEVEAGESAIGAELAGGRSGGAVLARALSARTERVATAMPLSSAEARALAEARYRARARGFLRATGVADGDAQIRVGATVDLGGLGTLFDGKYYVTVARHTFDLRHGYRTTFDAERAGIGA